MLCEKDKLPCIHRILRQFPIFTLHPYRPSIMILPTEVCECTVSFSHTVSVFTFLNSCTSVVSSIQDFFCQDGLALCVHHEDERLLPTNEVQVLYDVLDELQLGLGS